MPNINFICPNCNEQGKFTLMGESHGDYEKACDKCKKVIELKVKNNILINTSPKEKLEGKTKRKYLKNIKNMTFKKKMKKIKIISSG